MREFLKSLELEQDTIEKIMAEHGKDLTNLEEKSKSQLEDYKNQITYYKQKIETYESQINDLNGKIEENNKSLENLQSLTDENRNLKAEVQMNGSNVKKEFMKFVTSEVSSRVNDETDFAQALDDYKKENPQYFGDTVVKKVQSSPTLTGGSQPTSTNDIMNNILRGATQNE